MSKTVFRYDRGGSLRSPITTPQGFLRLDGHAARVGIYEYRRADGTVQYELRPRDEVFHADSLASYDTASITLGHPADEEVNAENVRKHEVGSVTGPGRADGDAVAVSLVIKDAKAIRAVKAGKQELSPGYKIRLDETDGFAPEYATPGNPTGRYHAIQRDIRVNHQAIVDKARGGSSMRLRMDSAELVLRDDAAPKYAVGDRVEATASHMPGMAGMAGTVEIANEGTPPYYAIRFDDQAMFPGVHKWLAEDELRTATARADATLSAKERHELPAEDFAVPDAEALPISDATHLRAAMARFNQYEFKDDAEKRSAYRKILAKAKALDVDASGFAEEHRADEHTMMTTAVAGHQHLLNCHDWNGCEIHAGDTSWATSEGADNGHTHPWVRDATGKYTIGESEGHSHTLLEDNAAFGYSSAGVTPRADTEFDRSGTGRDPGVTMSQQNTGGSAPPPDQAEQVRLLTVRADEADRSLTHERTRADTATQAAERFRAELATAKERIKALEIQLAAGASAVETAAVTERNRRIDELERELSDVRTRQPEIVKRRASIIAKAGAVLGPTFRADGLQDHEILAAAVKHLRPKEDVGPHVSEEYLTRRLDSLIEDRTAHAVSMSRASEVLAVRHDAAPTAQNKPRVAWQDAWKQGAGQFATANRKGS